MTALEALEACSFDKWYPALKAVTIKSVILPLSEEFVQHILADGVFATDGGDGSSDGSDGDDAAKGNDEWSAAEQPRFPELERAIGEVLDRFGGTAFVKLNWSAPKDAAWLLGGSLKCVTPTDVITLLQSSDHIAHDLCDARRACLLDAPGASGADAAAPAAAPAAAHDAWRGHSWVLVMRRWSNLRTSNEFRCFSVGGHLIAACQRDRYAHYEFLTPMRGQLLQLLTEFGERHLGKPCLPHAVVWDAYVDTANKVYLIDVAVAPPPSLTQSTHTPGVCLLRAHPVQCALPLMPARAGCLLCRLLCRLLCCLLCRLPCRLLCRLPCRLPCRLLCRYSRFTRAPTRSSSNGQSCISLPHGSSRIRAAKLVPRHVPPRV